MLGRGQICGTSTAQIFGALDINHDNRVDLHEFSAPFLNLKGNCKKDPLVSKKMMMYNLN